MDLPDLLFTVLTGLAVNECSHFSEWAAGRLIGWAVRLSYGNRARAQVRLIEHTGDLDRCSSQLGKLCLALGFTVRGILDWIRRKTDRFTLPHSGWPDPVDFPGMTVEAVSLALRGFDDIAALPRADRKKFGVWTARLRELLGHPAEVFDQDSTAQLLTAAASACEVYIDDRDERTAESLANAAHPLAERLAPDHPAVLDLRRGYAYTQLQLGRYERAVGLLRELSVEETRTFGDHDPATFRTRRLLSWAQGCAKLLPEAEAGFRDLDTRMAQQPNADMPLRLHIHCMLSWTIFLQGRLEEAAHSYDAVISGRSRELGPDHRDTLDAQHSKGKMFVLSGDGSRAHAVLQPVLAHRTHVRGRHHPDTLETRKYLAVAGALTRPHSARTRRKTLRELRRIMWMQTKKLGSDHPNTHDTWRWLATLAGPTEKRCNSDS